MGKFQEKPEQVPKIGKRHVLALWMFSGFVIMLISRASLNNAIVAMINDTALEQAHATKIYNKSSDEGCPAAYGEDEATNSTKKEGEFKWDKETQGLILSSFYYGYICTQFLGGVVAQIVSPRLMVGISIGGTGLVTILNPVAARTHPTFLMVLRILAGLLQGIIFPSVHSLFVNWVPKQERSVLVGFTVTGCQFGIMFAAPLTAVLCEYGFDGGWPTPFYIFGTCGLLWCIGWFAFVQDSPAKHATISHAERNYIENNCEKTADPVALRDIPWKSILLSRPFWALVVAQVSHTWLFDTQVIELSTYLKDVLHIGNSFNGIVTMLPFVSVFVLQSISAFLADYLLATGRVPLVWLRKGFYSSGMVISAGTLIIVGYVGCNTTVVIFIFCIALGFSGAPYVVYMVNHVDIAPKYAGFLMGIANTFTQLPGIFSPLITSALTENESSINTWQIVFYVSAAVSVFGSIVFLLFGDAKVQPWAEDTVPKMNDENDESPREEERNF